METEELLDLLRREFDDLPEPPRDYVARVADDLARLPARGRPRNAKKTALHREVTQALATNRGVRAALRQSVDQHPDAKPRQRRTQDHDDQYRDPEDDIDTLRREYHRHAPRHHPLLDPSKSYSIDDFFWCVLLREFERATAIYATFGPQFRKQTCLRLRRVITRRETRRKLARD
ncbi:hypothetical protein GCM10007276_07000 [Agaricicola taiwanensis]|uniref:Uncharacterized protein n=1 Tax=Agaricicola taiwanensis TaxID=591372 RepID=A0A8J2VMW1_9RHOB|nr:hypothetical protein [Agaricicola taiwanensis]GGE32357.1 hypothetical protein GCM10007276_07000 [Agaricicola taiwanensis]